MRASRVVLGGGRRFFHPKYVWSPAGGYWNDGPELNLKQLAILGGAWATGIYIVAQIGSGAEVRFWQLSSVHLLARKGLTRGRCCRSDTGGPTHGRRHCGDPSRVISRRVAREFCSVWVCDGNQRPCARTMDVDTSFTSARFRDWAYPTHGNPYRAP